MNTIKSWTLAAATGFLACAAGAYAADNAASPAPPMDHSKMIPNSKPIPLASLSSTVLTLGEVRKLDTEQGKITIKHGTIVNLDMPPMTMVFRATKPEMLAGLKPGDKIRFHAESAAGSFSVTHIEKAD